MPLGQMRELCMGNSMRISMLVKGGTDPDHGDGGDHTEGMLVSQQR